MLGRLLCVQPNKCAEFLKRNGAKYGQRQGQICLTEHLLAGPFNYEGRKTAEEKYGRQWRFQIHPDRWESLRQAGADQGLKVNDIDQPAQVEKSTV